MTLRRVTPGVLLGRGGGSRVVALAGGACAARLALALLEGPAGELVTPLVALAAQPGAAAGRAGGARALRQQLEQHQAAPVADAVIAELDDPGVPTGAVGEVRGDVVEQL